VSVIKLVSGEVKKGVSTRASSPLTSYELEEVHHEEMILVVEIILRNALAQINNSFYAILANQVNQEDLLRNLS
jgi:hypothetical protein